MSTAAVMDQQEYPEEAIESEHSQQEFALQESKGEAPSIWRSLMHLRLLLPYIGKLLPILEGNFSAASTTALAPAPAVARPDMTEFHQSLETVNRGFLDLQAGNRDIRTHVQEQATQLKRIDDQLIRLRESTERNTMEHQELVEDLKSASKMVRGLSTVMIILMVVVAAMVAVMLLHWRH
jgi:hypothetical protein